MFMTRNQQISILGCGWLGFPLAQKLIEKGFKVKGSTTSTVKKSLLEKERVNAFLIDIDDLNKTTFKQFIEGSQVVVFAIPPRRKIGDSSGFLDLLRRLFVFIQPIQKVLLVSSTSIYPNTNDWVTEEINLLPDTQRGKLMYRVEHLFKDKFEESLTIVRMAGLIGPNRNPGKFLAGKINLPNGMAPVNLIHQDDAVGVLMKIIEEDFWGEIVNGVCSDHPSRKDYYTKVSLEFGLEVPVFLENVEMEYKLVSNKKSKVLLGYSYKASIC